MTFTPTTFVDYQATPKVTAAFLNNVQVYMLAHHLEHMSTGTDPITFPVSTAVAAHAASHHLTTGADPITFFASTAHAATHLSTGTDPISGLKFFQYIPIPAKDWVAYTPLSESGDACIYETSQRSNGPAQVQLVYASTLAGLSTIGKENAYARVCMPGDWDGGMLTANMVTETTVSSTTKTISFKIYGYRIGDGSTANLALTTANSASVITLTDTNMGPEFENHSSESSQFTIAGSGGDIRLRLTCNSSDHTSTTKIKFHKLMLKCICTKVATT